MFRELLDDTSLAKIEAFCKSDMAAESTLVEYKRALPEDIERTIASLANTYGGVLFLGIGTDKKTNKPNLPPAWLDLTPGLEEKITSIALTRITPPVIPDVRIIRDPEDAERCIVLIHVIESTQTPHAVDKNRRVYIRVNSQNSPYDLADLDRISWLNNRRAKAEEFRETLKRRPVDRFLRNCKRSNTAGRMEFHLIPRFPYEPYIARRDLPTVVRNLGRDQTLLCTTIGGNRLSTGPVTGGLGFWVEKDGGGPEPARFAHWEFSIYGGVHLVLSWDPTVVGHPDGDESQFDVRLWAVYGTRFLFVAGLWLKKLLYSGVLEFEVRVSGIQGLPVSFIIPLGNKLVRSSPQNQSVEESVESRCSVPWNGPSAESTRPVADALLDVLWDMGGDKGDGSSTSSFREICESMSNALTGVDE